MFKTRLNLTSSSNLNISARMSCSRSKTVQKENKVREEFFVVEVIRYDRTILRDQGVFPYERLNKDVSFVLPASKL